MNEVLVIIVLILLNGALAMSEIALISVRKSHLANEMKKGSKAAKIALKLANEPDKFLSTIQIGITVIGILTGIYSGSVLADSFSEVIVQWGVPISYSHILAQAVIVVLVTYFSIILGELVPKRIGMNVAERVAITIARPMYLISKIASPFVWLLSKSTHLIVKLLNLKSESSKVTEDEIKSMIEEGAKDGSVQEVEQDIMERVFMLGDLRVNSLMTHRSDVVYLDRSMSRLQVLQVLENSIYELYPIVNGSLDNVIGVIKLKELVLKLYNDNDFTLEHIIHKPFYFHESMSVYKVLEQMRQFRLSQGLVCDEFGSVQGIITLKDILEGLIGEIQEPFEEPSIVVRQDGRSWLVNGQCPIYDFLSYFDRDDLFFCESGYNTIGGLILKELEHIPISGESLEWHGFNLEIVDMDGARIDKILVNLDR